MACLYCGKRVSLVRQMADPDFCSDEHRRRYHDMARAALNRLLELDGAEAAEPAERKRAVSRSGDDSHAHRPEPPAHRTQTAQPATGARRRVIPAAHRPPLLAEAVPPAERDIIPTQVGIHDSDVVLWGEADCEFTAAVTLLDLPALWARRAPIYADFRPYRQRAAADAGACRNYPPLLFAPAEAGVPLSLSLVRGYSLAGLAMHGHRALQVPVRARFARCRTSPPTRLIGRDVRLPALESAAQASGIPILLAARRALAPFAHASHPALLEIALASPAVRLPGLPSVASPKSRPVVSRAVLESAEPRGFRTIAPPARTAAAQAPAASGTGASRTPDPVLPKCALCIRVQGGLGICTASPSAMNPLAGARPKPLTCDSAIQLAAGFGMPLPAQARAAFALPPGRLLPPAVPAGAARMSRPLLAPAESDIAQRARAIPLPVWEPLAGTGAARTDCIDSFPAILRQPRPLGRPTVPRVCDTAVPAPPPLFMPVVDRDGPSFTAAGLPFTPEPPRGRKPPGSSWLPGGFARPDHPAPRPGDRKPIGAAEACKADLVLAASRPVQSHAGSKFTSRGMAAVAAPAPRKSDTTVRMAQAPFSELAVRHPNAGTAGCRHQISGHGPAPVATAPSRRAAKPAACEPGTNVREALLPRPAAAGNARTAGIAAASTRKAEPPTTKGVATIFRSEPVPAPPLPVPGTSLPAYAGAPSIRRLIPEPSFQRAVRPEKFLRSLTATAIPGECMFRTAIALPARALRMRAACRIAQGTEIRNQRTPSAAPCVPKASQGYLAPPELGLPGSRRMAFVPPGLSAAQLSRREVSRSECAETRRPAPAAPSFRLSGGVPRAAAISTPVANDRRVGAPRAVGPKAEDGARLKRRGEGVQPALATAQPIGIVVLPEFKSVLPHPAYALFGFARLEVPDYDDLTHAKTLAAEALPPDPLLPRLFGPRPVLVRVPRISGVLNGYPLSHAGVRALLEANRGMEIEIEPVTPAFVAVPETDEREEALAPAVPDDGRRGWGAAKRLFR